MVNVPHFDYPFRLGTNSHPVEVEQNSQKDVMNCVTAALKTVRGQRLYVPAFGVDDPVFNNAPLDLVAIEQQIRESEPRADLASAQQIEDLVAKLTIGVGTVE